MQKVITVFLSTEALRNATVTNPGAFYENKELNKYLEEDYKIKERTPVAVGTQNLMITFLLEKTEKKEVAAR